MSIASSATEMGPAPGRIVPKKPKAREDGMSADRVKHRILLVEDHTLLPDLEFFVNTRRRMKR